VSTNATKPARLEFIDAERGLAVVLMLWMHSADGWLRPELKQGAAWNVIRSLGGLAAPTFLLLAGVSLGFGWATGPQNLSTRQRRNEVARGLQLVVLGYALRLYMWMLDGGGALRLSAWSAALPLCFGFYALHRALGDWAADRPARRLGLLGLGSSLLGAYIVSILIPDRLWRMTRVDILQAIGASLACVALARGAILRRPALAVVAALGVALATPWLRAWLPGPLPEAIAGYLAAWDTPAGAAQPTLFPLFPWAAYVLIGSAVGIHFGRVQRSGGNPERAAIALAACGVLLAIASCEPLRPVHTLITRWPILTQPVRVAYRVGAALALGGLSIALVRPRVALRGPLLSLGRTSLFVYWVHLEIAFGLLAKPIAHRLALPAWALGFVALCAAMAALSVPWQNARRRFAERAIPRARIEEGSAKPATFTSA
jgi:uncharacterized membrane protein